MSALKIEGYVVIESSQVVVVIQHGVQEFVQAGRLD
jgi:hypothetical protein